MRLCVLCPGTHSHPRAQVDADAPAAVCMRICAYGSVCMRDGVSVHACMHAGMHASARAWSRDFVQRCMCACLSKSAGSYVHLCI